MGAKVKAVKLHALAAIIACCFFQTLAPAQEDKAEQVQRSLALRITSDFSLRIYVSRSGEPKSVVQQVSQRLKQKCKKTLPELYESCHLDESQIQKQEYAADAEIRSIERAIKNWERRYGVDSVENSQVRTAQAEIIDLNYRIENCIWNPDGLFQRILQGQLSEPQKQAYRVYLLKLNDKLPQFIRAISRAAVLSASQAREITKIMHERLGKLKERSLSECAKSFLELVESNQLAELLAPRELAASKRLCNYFIDNKK